ncbi:hypothetical protein FRC17_001722 [Serendipita sp. 399]|nr:hypothetical protein FRC17_001722 [Serendipita sp. 399]
MAKVLQPCKNLKLVSLPSGEWLSYKDSNNNDSDGMVSTTTATTPLPYYARLRECIPTNKSRISEVYKYNIHLHLAESNNRYPDIRGILAIDPWLAYHTAKDPSYFPRLCTLYVSQNVNQDFITTHGFKITTVDLMDTQWSHFIPYLKHFPNLRTVILDVKPFYQDRIWGPTPSSSLVCATVRDIGLTRKRIMSLKPYYNLIFKELLVIFPNAVRIRILDFPFVEVMAQQLRKSCPWYRTLAIKKIRLEREDGSLFW